MAFLDLSRGPGKDVGVWIGGGPVSKARVRETVGRAPQQADARVGLQLLGQPHDVVEAVVALFESLAFGCDVAVVPAVERRAELGDELKGRAQGVLGALHGVGGAVPGPVVHRSRAERIDTSALKAVPKGHGKAQVLGHGLAADRGLGVVVLEG